MKYKHIERRLRKQAEKKGAKALQAAKFYRKTVKRIQHREN